MTSRFLPLVVALASLAACQKGGGHAEHAHPPPPATATAPVAAAPAAPAANPVQHEMRLLTATLQGGIQGLGMGDVTGIARSLHEVHGAKEATAAALKSGSYKPPKNGDQLARFVELDEAFHELLYPLVRASKANDLPATAEALGAVLRGCQGCHQEFREGFSAPAPAAPPAF